jgi:anti-sigma factor RsiW
MTDYLEGWLEDGPRASLERHLASCRGCAAYLEQMRQLIAALGRLRGEDLPPPGQAELVELFRGWRPSVGAGS